MSSPRLIRGRLITPTELLDDGACIIDGEKLAWVGPASEVPPQWQAQLAGTEPHDGYVLPGLIDVHCHGGGGESFPDATTRQQAQVAIDEHRRHGTTSLVASLVTASPTTLLQRTAMLAELADDEEITAIHLEGPFIATERCGAQNPAEIQEPDPVLTAQLLETGRGHVATMTIAPERPGAEAVIQTLIEHGALPAFGHTIATAEVTRQAVAQATDFLTSVGAPRSTKALVSHLFNGMNPMHHREPGPIPELLAGASNDNLVLELINDGTHIADSLGRSVIELVGRDNVVLVTDAMGATGMADGSYQLGSLAVTVTDGIARLRDGQSIAGGTSHLLDVVRTSVRGGMGLIDAVYLAATGPARVLGRGDIGALEAGRRADIVLCDKELRAIQVIRKGVRT